MPKRQRSYRRLLRRLNHKKEKVYAPALREVDALPPEELLELAKQEAVGFRVKRLWTFGYVLIFLVYAAVYFYDYQHDLSKAMTSIYPYAFFAFVCVMDLLFGTTTSARTRLTEVLSEASDKQIIPAALLMLQTHSTQSQILRNILRMRLPQLRAGDTASWTAEQKRALLLPMNKPLQDVAFTLALLKALEQVGDADALPIVTRLSEMEFTSAMRDWSSREKVKKAAQECLPFLEANAAHRRQTDTLLRPSDVHSLHKPEELLRPVENYVGETPPEQLLRPHNP